MIKRFIDDMSIDMVVVVVLGVFALYRWHAGIDQIVGMLIAIISIVFWVRAGRGDYKFPARFKDSVIYSKFKSPLHIFSLLSAIGFIIAIHFFSFYLLAIVLTILQVLRAKKEDEILELKFGAKDEDHKNGI
jgi:protein-S-isoprenylcysteine O-methyltransferase Ste14